MYEVYQMGAGRIVGGILALIGSVFLLIPLLMDIGFAFSTGGGTLFLYLVVLIIGVLALVGAILALANKRGVIALIMGIVLIILNILPHFILSPETDLLWVLTTQTVWEVYIADVVGFSFVYTIFITFEAILILNGGIIATVTDE
jgi:hypothetical protein